MKIPLWAIGKAYKRTEVHINIQTQTRYETRQNKNAFSLPFSKYCLINVKFTDSKQPFEKYIKRMFPLIYGI